MPGQLELPICGAAGGSAAEDLASGLRRFSEFGKTTAQLTLPRSGLEGGTPIPVFVNEFWTARQRAAHSLHEISYRACFKPQLPRFFIERLTAPGDIVYDPFMGRGTTVVEAALLGRIPCGCDVNPLSQALVAPRLTPPTAEVVARRLAAIDLDLPGDAPEDLLVFFHPDTLRQIAALRHHLLMREKSGALDALDGWIRMIALNRLTGHSAGFFSVYTLPPNQAVSVGSQRKINARLGQTPPRRDVPGLILRKTRRLLRDCDAADGATLAAASARALLLTREARATPELPDGSVDLVVTSPPFLNIVDYATDNWLRCWFLGIDPRGVRLAIHRKLPDWQAAMTAVFRELFRVLRTGGHIAFEVGELDGGRVRLEEAVVPCGEAAGLETALVLINDQKFTKTANCWGVANNRKGTNSNRIVVFRKP